MTKTNQGLGLFFWSCLMLFMGTLFLIPLIHSFLIDQHDTSSIQRENLRRTPTSSSRADR